VKTQEEVVTQQEVPFALWRDAISREGFWDEMRDHAVGHAASDGKVLTDTPGTRHVLYVRFVTGPDGDARFAECPEADAEFARLRLTCWASADETGAEG
jgi:hypothetical protein